MDTFEAKGKAPQQTTSPTAAAFAQSPAPSAGSPTDRAVLSGADVLALQRTAGNGAVGRLLRQTAPRGRLQKKEDNTGLPNNLKSGIESLSGYSMDDVRVHYNSAKPTRVNALAYTQGRDIEVAPGQERHLPHEGWHLVQQLQGRVKPSMQVGGVSINDDEGLEREADSMGSRAVGIGESANLDDLKQRVEEPRSISSSVMQLQKGLGKGDKVIVRISGSDGEADDEFDAEVVSVEDGGNMYTVHFAVPDYNNMFPTKYAETAVRGKKAISKQDVPVLTTVSTAPPWEQERLELPATAKAEVKKIVGDDATKITDLSEDQLERLIPLLRGVPQPSFHLQNLIASLEFDLKDLKAHNETPEQAEERRSRLSAETATAESDAFEAQFGVKLADATWQRLWPSILVWWAQMKTAEGNIEFRAAFEANRMTARQINVGSTARGGRFKVQKLGSTPDEKTDREMYLETTVGGIAKRTDPKNFVDKAAVNREGVHDLSASLLRGDKGIYEQLKKYEESVVLFIPLPEEKDLRIFSSLARLQGMDQTVITAMSSLLTRPVLAQASDMGTRYVDTESGPEQEGTFSYGLTGTVIRTRGDRARKINPADAAARRQGALSYTKMATAAVTKVNEVVMAYRKHESKLFPMFAAWDPNNKDFLELRADLTPTGNIITNDGYYK